MIRNVLDEMREQLTWGLQNGRVFISLVDPDERDPQADLEIESETIDLAVRLQTSQTTVAQDIQSAFDERRASSLLKKDCDNEEHHSLVSDDTPEAASNQTNVDRTLPKVRSLFDAAAFDPVSTSDVAPEKWPNNSVESPEVSADSLESCKDQKYHSLKKSFDVDDAVEFEHDGKRIAGKIITLPNDEKVIVEVADSEDVYYVSLDQLNNSQISTKEKFERWYTEVRDPAIANSEGIRKINSRYGKAEFQYEIAQIAEDKWAVSWHVSYRCGSFLGNSFPWKLNSSREECLQSAIENARKFFSAEQDDPTQNKARSEMLHKLKPRLGPFPEPNPDPAKSHPLAPDIDS